MRRRGLPPGVYWDERRKSFYMKFVDANGDRRTRAVGKDREIALKVHAQKTRELIKEKFNLGDETKQESRIDEVAAAYLDDLESKVSPRHFENVRHAIEVVRRRVTAMRFVDLKPALVESALEDLRSESRTLKNGREFKLSARTANKMIGHFQAMSRWAERTGRIARDPIRFVRKASETKVQVKRRHRLSIEETDAIIAAAERYDGGGRYLRAERIPQAPLLHVLRWTGLRFGEATTLRWSDFFETNENGVVQSWLRVRIENAKIGVERTCPVPRSVADTLNQLRSMQGKVIRKIAQKEGRIFLTPLGYDWDEHNNGYFLKWFNRILKFAGVPKTFDDGTTVDIHALRHSFCTQLRIAEVDLGTAADLMGHRDVNTTRRIYTESAQVTKPKARALGRLEDLARTDRMARRRRKEQKHA